MAPRSYLLDDAHAAYLVDHCGDPDGLQQRMIDETQALGSVAEMQVAPDEGAFLTLLARMTGARRALELGTFTGYSALCIARGIGPSGHLLCCDISDDYAGVARGYWEADGVADRVEQRIGPAADTLRSLPAGTQFDLVFIDADKPGYPEYWELVVPMVPPGGVVLADNVLRHGLVVDPQADDDATEAVRRFNDAVAADRRFDSVILPLADGLTVARRRDERGTR